MTQAVVVEPTNIHVRVSIQGIHIQAQLCRLGNDESRQALQCTSNNQPARNHETKQVPVAVHYTYEHRHHNSHTVTHRAYPFLALLRKTTHVLLNKITTSAEIANKI